MISVASSIEASSLSMTFAVRVRSTNSDERDSIVGLGVQFTIALPSRSVTAKGLSNSPVSGSKLTNAKGHG